MLILASAIVFVGCAENQPAPVEDRSFQSEPMAHPSTAPIATTASTENRYRVEAGDTLYSIAFKRGLDYRDVASWNGIEPPYRIFVGQELRMSSASATVVSSAPVPMEAIPPGETVVTRAAPDQGKAATVTTLGSSPTVAKPIQPTAPPQASKPAPVAPPTIATATPPPPSSAQPLPEPTKPPPIVASKPEPASSSNGSWRWPSSGAVVGNFVGGDQTRQGIDIAGKSGDPVLASADGDVVYSGNGLLGYGELIIIKHNSNFLSAYGHNRKRLVQEGEKVHAGQQIAEMGSSASSRDELHFEIRKNGKPVNPMEYLPNR